MKRFYYNGKARQSGFLDDYAWMVKANISLYRATKKRPYLNRAFVIMEAIDKKFYIAPKRNYAYADKTSKLPLTIFKNEDSGDIPSPNAILVHAFIDMYEIEKVDAWADKADTILQATAQEVRNNVPTHGTMIHAQMRYDKIVDEKRRKAATAGLDATKIVQFKEVKATPRTPNEWIISASFEIQDGWYITSNNPGLDFLVPTRFNAYVQDIYSVAGVRYPLSVDKQTPLGTMGIYENGTMITANLKAQDTIPKQNLRVILEFQTCSKDGECLPPAKIVAKGDDIIIEQ